jgi:nucleoside-diphosphate-sugar epimerase
VGVNPLPPVPTADLDHIVARTRDLWPELRGKRLFITGGTGFFGTWLLESFVRANESLELNAGAVVLTRNPDAFRAKAPHLASNPAVELMGGDMCTCPGPQGEVYAVIHAATEPLLPAGTQHPKGAATDPLTMFDRNVAGTRRMLDIACQCKISRFLLTSSGAVYGRQPANLPLVTEDYAGAPDTQHPHLAYGQAKRISEFLGATYAKRHGLEVKIARPFAFVGPHLALDANYAVGNFIRDALKGGPINIGGDGSPYRSYLYAADLTAWLWTILFKGESCRPYNVGSDAALTIRSLADQVARQIAPAAEISAARQPTRGKPGERYVPSIERARRELGLDVWIPLPDAIRRTADWYRPLQPHAPDSSHPSYSISS